MKDWEDVIKQRLAGRKAELPESDWNDFLSRKADRERAAQRRRRLIALSVSIPAAAAVLLLLLLVPFRTAVPENQISQNQSSEPQTVADSIATPVDTIVKELPPVVMEKPKVEIAQVKPKQKSETDKVDELLADNKVSAVVAKVQMPNDTAIFNMEAYKLPEGASVEDIIRKLPGVQIDSEGNITVNGRSVSRILVNGKEFFNDDNTKSLTQLTAEMIEKVKAYEKNSDLSRQTGYDDGREETVLDLVSVRGKVYDSETAEPLSDASVQIYRVTRKGSTFICSTLTRYDGSFIVYNLERGKYVARASLEDYINGESRFKVRSGYKANNRVKIAIRRVDR